MVERGWDFATLLDMDLASFNSLVAISEAVNTEKKIERAHLDAVAANAPEKLKEISKEMSENAGLSEKPVAGPEELKARFGRGF